MVMGSGRVVAQRPAPGTRLEPASRVTLLLEHRRVGAGIAEASRASSKAASKASSRGLGRSGP
jgi:beta-lactam-binding protein with PASTA domain